MERRNLLIYVIINGITTSNASHSPRNDRESLCETQMANGTATFPLSLGEGNVNFIFYNIYTIIFML